MRWRAAPAAVALARLLLLPLLHQIDTSSLAAWRRRRALVHALNHARAGSSPLSGGETARIRQPFSVAHRISP